MNAQMIRVISSPSSSTIGFSTLIFAIDGGDPSERADAISRTMATAERSTGAATHEVFNQPPPLEDYNPFDADRPLVEALRREGAEWAEDRAREVGAFCGSRQRSAGASRPTRTSPKLRTHDRYGHRIDEVEFDPSWHELMRIGVGHELHASPWRDPRPGAHVARAATFMLLMQAEAASAARSR